LRSLYC